MSTIGKLAGTGVLAASLMASSFSALPAQAHDHGLGLGLGLAAGLIAGGILLNEHRNYHPNYYYGDAGYNPGPACYPGPLQWRWQQVCRPDAYGQLYCQNVKSYFRPEICN